MWAGARRYWGAAAGAAQQIMSTLFWGSTTLSAEPFNTAGQTFLPDHYDPETPDVITPRFRLTLQRLLDSSLLWGLAITLGTYPLKSEKALSMFTTSKDVMRLVAIGPILAVGALIAPDAHGGGYFCVEIKFYGSFAIVASTSTPSTLRLLDGVAVPVPRRSSGQHGHVIAEKVHPTHWLISAQVRLWSSASSSGWYAVWSFPPSSLMGW